MSRTDADADKMETLKQFVLSKFAVFDLWFVSGLTLSRMRKKESFATD